jgi:ABC-type spermidine/putrescine transport system permease subunit I
MHLLSSAGSGPVPSSSAAAGAAAPQRPRRAAGGGFALAHALPPLAWQLAFFAAPLLFLVVLSFWTVRSFRVEPAFDAGNWQRMLVQGYVWETYARTFAYAFVATACATVLAFPAAYAIAFRLGANARRICLFLLVIPFFTSYLVRIYAWQVFLADQGVINALLGMLGLPAQRMLNTPLATLVGYLTLNLSLVVLVQAMSLMLVDRRLVEAAANLGCGPVRTVFAVIIPAGRTGIVIAALFCFIFSFGDFVSPLYLGGGAAPTLPILIVDTTKAGQQWPRAAVLALLMIATLMAVARAMTAYAYRRRA